MIRTQRNLMNGIILRAESGSGECAFQISSSKTFPEFRAYYYLQKRAPHEEVAVRFNPRKSLLEMCIVQGDTEKVTCFLYSLTGIKPKIVNSLPLGIPYHIGCSVYAKAGLGK